MAHATHPPRRSHCQHVRQGMLRRLRILTCLAAIFAGQHSSIASPADRSVIFGQSTAIVDLGPAYAAFQQYPAGYEAALAIYDRLVTLDAKLAVRPQLAERWERAADRRSVTFYLRRGASFHDGTPVDAAAVKFNIDRMVDPQVNTTNRPLWDPIAGADVMDSLTVKIRSRLPLAELLSSLAHGSGAIVSPAAIARRGERSMALQPIGSGPFRVERFVPGQSLRLTAFNRYWAGPPRVERLVFRYMPDPATRIAALRSGAVDVIDAVPAHMAQSLSRDPRLQVLRTSSLRPMGLAFLTTREPWNDRRIRRALNHALPGKLIAERVFLGFAQQSESPLAPRAAGYRRIARYEYSADLARRLLSEAGYADRDGDGVIERSGEPLRLTLLAPDGAFPKDLLVAQVAAHAFRSIGIAAQIFKVEQGSYWETLRAPARDAEWDLALFGFNPSNARGLYHLQSLFQSNPDDAARPAVWNVARFRSERVDDLLAAAATVEDEDQRSKLLGDAQEEIWSEAPCVWMYVNDVVSAARRELAGAEVWPTSFTVIRDAHY